jgi:hypothetical protein
MWFGCGRGEPVDRGEERDRVAQPLGLVGGKVVFVVR